ncbi:MAG: hypothetical protein HUU20_17595 [Pirellulales bacterium]|nr:hypothetical protein [Pirellulales bacterium]
MRSAGAVHAKSRAPRRAVITLWTILFLPAMLLLVLVVLEIGNMWNARVELNTALEAAALAGAKHWGEATNKDTQTPRTVALDYAEANTIDKRRLNNGHVDLLANYDTNAVPLTNPNQNLTGTGNVLIFGAVSLNHPFSFNANVAPQCELVQDYGTIGLKIIFDTGPQGDTFRDADAFSIEFLNQPNPPAGVYITKITLDLQVTGADDGEFDVNTVAPALSENLTDGTRQGWGPYFNSGASSGIAGAVAFVPDGSSASQATKLEMTFAANDFAPGDTFVFGVDTDKVGTEVPSSPADGDTENLGSDFSDSQAPVPPSRFRLTIEFSNGASLDINGDDPAIQTTAGKTFTPTGLSKSLLIIIPATGEFGVRAQASVDVVPLCNSLLGIPVGPLKVSGVAYARSGCNITQPQLIRVDSYTPPPP